MGAIQLKVSVRWLTVRFPLRRLSDLCVSAVSGQSQNTKERKGSFLERFRSMPGNAVTLRRRELNEAFDLSVKSD